MKNRRAPTASCSITIDPLTGSPQILNAQGNNATAFQLLGYLFLAGARSLRSLFTGTDDEDLTPEEFAKYIEDANLEIKEANGSYCFFAVSSNKPTKELPLSNDIQLNSQVQDTPPPVTEESKQGTTIYHIQNLTINLSAEVITQLNLNPEKVMNVFQQHLQAELDQIVSKEIHKAK